MDNQGSTPSWSRGVFYPPLRLDRLWVPPSFPFKGYWVRGSYPEGKAAGARNWQLTRT